MHRHPVSSSSLVSVGYDSTNSTLEVEFHGGSIYEYYDVPAHVHTGLMSAGSHGSYFDANVKKAGYAYNRIG